MFAVLIIKHREIMEKHFELTEEFKINFLGVKLFRIKATKDFKSISIGDLGGFVEKIENLSGNAWVSGDAWVSGNARVYGDAEVSGDNDICWFSKFGSSNRTTTFFKSKEEKIKVKCGCFFGDLIEFESKVKETHSGNKFEKEYLLMIELAKIKLQ